MPFYDFECPRCGAREVVPREIGERDAAPACFLCGEHEGAPMVRVPSVPGGFVFKGAGFHSVDYPKER